MFKNLPKRITTAAIFGCIITSTFFLLPPIYFSVLLLSMLGYILLFELPYLYHGYWWLLVPVYPTIPFILLISMNEQSTYRYLLPFLFISVFTNDTGAYFAGKLWGKNLLLPIISPQKTWEGFIGGYLATSLSIFILLYCCYRTQSILFTLTMSLFISILATIGDFFESWLKRRAKIKDVGDILPGHGGLLDRFDSILSTTIFFYLLKDYLITYL